MVEAFFIKICWDRVKMNKMIKLMKKISNYRRTSNYIQMTAKRNHYQINSRAHSAMNIWLNQVQMLRSRIASQNEKFRKYQKRIDYKC